MVDSTMLVYACKEGGGGGGGSLVPMQPEGERDITSFPSGRGVVTSFPAAVAWEQGWRGAGVNPI